MNKPKPFFQTWHYIFITIGTVLSIRNLPMTAMLGKQTIAYFICAALLFLIPSTLIAAKLASRLPDSQGIYTWVKAACGERLGFFAVWLQWVQNVVWYPTILSFIASTIAYCISPDLVHHKSYLIMLILFIFWTMTIINLFGIQSSVKWSIFFTLIGLLLPFCLLIILGGPQLLMGSASGVNLSDPTIKHTHLMNTTNPIWLSLSALILSFSGMEIAAVYREKSKIGHKNYQRGLFIAAVIIIFCLIIGSLIFANMIPNPQNQLLSSLAEVIRLLFGEQTNNSLFLIAAGLIVLGSLGTIHNWIIASTQSLSIALQDMQVRSYLLKKNKRDVPYVLLMLQGLIASCLVFLFLYFPSINQAYAVLTIAGTQLYMMMYIFMFFSAIKIAQKDRKSPPYSYHPSTTANHLITWIISLVGILGSSLTFIIGFIPPYDIKAHYLLFYEIILFAGLIIIGFFMPWVILFWHQQQKSWDTVSADQ